jgi:signal transduction histidine kinase
VARAADPQALRQEKLALVGECLADASHECNNQLAFVLSNLQNLVEYGDDLARVVSAYREKLAAAGAGDAALAKLEAEVDLDFLLEDAGRAARDGLTGATRLRDLLRVLGRIGEDEPADKPLIDLGKAVRQVLCALHKAISLRAELTAELDLDVTVAAPQSLVTRAVVVMLKHALASFHDRAAQERHRLLVRLERRGAEVAVVVARAGGADPARPLLLAELAAEAMDGRLEIEEDRTTLVLEIVES